MGFEYIDVERIERISKADFIKNYKKPQKPVVIEKLTEDWPAYNKWSFDYLMELAGDKIVPLYNNDPVDPEKKVNEPIMKIPLREYVDILRQGPTDLRIFLYNLMKQAPELQNDFQFPDIGLKLFKSLPMLFVGGSGSNVFMHYDIDYANILHFHFEGKKECIIVPPEQTKYMYRHPFNWICREDINFDEPDFEKFPALRYVRPMRAILNHGECLYMPEGYWHYMKYITPGFSLSLRSFPTRPTNRVKALNNIFIMRNVDNVMRKIKGYKWIEYKDKKAVINTHKHIK